MNRYECLKSQSKAMIVIHTKKCFSSIAREMFQKGICKRNEMEMF